jgi:hypothetical protein
VRLDANVKRVWGKHVLQAPPPPPPAAAPAAAAPEFLAAVRRIRDRVTRFQEAVLARDVTVPLAGGGSLRQRYVPLGRIGVCVPGGAAAYPSTLLMTVVPAQVAGVPEIVVVAPPTAFGADNPHVLATCHELGVTTVVRAGGARKAYVESIPVEINDGDLDIKFTGQLGNPTISAIEIVPQP